MADLQQTARYRVFPVQLKGDTLVICPKGDRAGFSSTEFHGERDALCALIAKGNAANVIVDLSGSDYFGSEMIGAINSFGAKAKARGGRFGVCEVSDNMREGLAIMRLDTLWSIYPTRRDALRAIATESVGQKAKAYRGPMLAAAAAGIVLAAGYVWWFDPFHRIDRAKYNLFADVYKQAYQLRETKAPIAEWGKLGDNVRSDIEAAVDTLKESPTRLDRTKQRLLWVGRDFLVPLTAKNPQRPSDADWTTLSGYMRELQREFYGDQPLIADDADLDGKSPGQMTQSAANSTEKAPKAFGSKKRDDRN